MRTPLRGRITALGGTPTMEVSKDDLIPATTLEEILDVNISEEKKAIALYRSILKMVEHDEVILYEAVEHIIEDEQWRSLIGCASSVIGAVVVAHQVRGWVENRVKALVLLRHGESTWNQENRFTGWTPATRR